MYLIIVLHTTMIKKLIGVIHEEKFKNRIIF
ncbi:hypothetical protein BH10BAC5_BH10BAC5_20050 [soil metagenome]